MSYRVLLVVFAVMATTGLSPRGLAEELPSSSSNRLVSQADTNTLPAQPQPSPAVQGLQNRLNQLGFYNGPINGLGHIHRAWGNAQR